MLATPILFGLSLCRGPLTDNPPTAELASLDLTTFLEMLLEEDDSEMRAARYQ
jgi:hypothetical protein